MQIYLLRHAEAEERREEQPDEERALTPKGHKRLHKAGRGFRRLELFPERILSSPLKRAVQTAEIVAEEVGFVGDIEAVEELAPGSDPEELIEVLRQLRPVSQILLVGHQPFLGELVGLLIGGPQAQIGIKKGGLVRVDVKSWEDDPVGRLRFLLTLKQLTWIRRKKKASSADSEA